MHQALVALNDVVMVDRNCHKSHHHAVMLHWRASRVLEAYLLNDFQFTARS